MKLLFKKFTAKNWLVLLAIFLLTCGQVFYMMRTVEAIGGLTVGMQFGDLDYIWANGKQLVFYALFMLVFTLGTVVFASWNASDIVTRLRDEVYRTCTLCHQFHYLYLLLLLAAFAIHF